MKIALRLFIFSVVMQVAGYATSYYFSQSTGSDSNGCTSASPCKTLAKANGLTLSPGDSIVLMCGDTWMETLTPQRSDMNYDHWGSCNTTTGGNLPPVVMGSTAVCGYPTLIHSRCTMDINGKTNITVKHIDFNGSNQGGVGGQIWVHGASSAILFDYLKIHFSYQNEGIACATTTNIAHTLTVANSQISANSFEAAYVRGSGSGFCNIDLVNNLIVANTVRQDHDLATPHTYGLLCFTGSTCTLKNNLIGGNGRWIWLEKSPNWIDLGGNLFDSYVPSVVNWGFNEWYFMGTNDGDSADTGNNDRGMLSYAIAFDDAGGTAPGVWDTCTGASGWTIGTAAIDGFGLDDLTDMRAFPDSGVAIPSNTWTLTPLDTAEYYRIELAETKSLIENTGTDMWGNQQLGLGQEKRVCFGSGKTNTAASAAAQAAGFYSMLTGSCCGATDLTHFYNYYGTEAAAVGNLFYFGGDEASVRAAMRFYVMAVPFSGSIYGLYWHTPANFQQTLVWAQDEFHKWTGRYWDTYNGAYSALETTHTCSGIVPNAYCDPKIPVVDTSDFHPVTGGVQIGAGLNLGAGYDVDMDGNSQPASGPWTIGPYAVSSGGGAAVSLSPASLDFGPQGTNRPTTPQAITLTSSGAAALSITGISITGANSQDFDQWNNCPMSPNTLAPGDHCTITVMFAPIDIGALNADVTITDNAPDSPQMVPLTGTGVGGKVGLK